MLSKISAHALAQAEIARHAGYEVADPGYPAAVATWLSPIRDMVSRCETYFQTKLTFDLQMLPILLTSRTDSPLVRKRSKHQVETFDMKRHIHELPQRRAEAAAASNGTSSHGSSPSLGPLVIKKASYADPSLRLGVEENVRRQVNNLADDEFIQQQWALGKNVTIHGEHR